MRLHQLRNVKGARHRRKRLGCGESSGHGKTSTRGGKGQTARTGGALRIPFEGGQTPYIRRFPKRGFNNANYKIQFAVVNLDALNQFNNNSDVDPDVLKKSGLVKGRFDGIKILGQGKLEKKLNIKAHAFSASAKEQIEKAGGQAQVLATARKAPEPVTAQKAPKSKPAS
jgi:large subunit ribosomal protein L15